MEKLEVCLYALAPELASELERALVPVCSKVDTAGTRIPAGADVIFCRSDLNEVTMIRAAAPRAAIIVVSRVPEIAYWLDSMEAGADDYCAAPFETVQLQWILQASQQSHRLAA
jgi:DNA-binding NarL/FixJ family response regulator